MFPIKKYDAESNTVFLSIHKHERQSSRKNNPTYAMRYYFRLFLVFGNLNRPPLESSSAICDLGGTQQNMVLYMLNNR